MTRPVLATGALVVIVAILGAALLLGRGPSANVGGPSASPSPSATAVPTVAGSTTPTAAAAGPLQGQLFHRWMGGSRNPDRYRCRGRYVDHLRRERVRDEPVQWQLDPGDHRVSHVDRQPQRAPRVHAGRHELHQGRHGPVRLVRQRRRTDTHHHARRRTPVPRAWRPSLAPGTSTAARTPRPTAWATSRPAPMSRSTSRPGSRATDTWHPVYAAVTYTVPDGWANSSDWPNVFGLTPSTAYDALPAGRDEGSQSILVLARATPMARQSDPVRTDGQGRHLGLVDPRQRDHVAASRPWRDHHGAHPRHDRRSSGQWMDSALDAAWGKACKSGPGGASGISCRASGWTPRPSGSG